MVRPTRLGRCHVTASLGAMDRMVNGQGTFGTFCGGRDRRAAGGQITRGEPRRATLEVCRSRSRGRIPVLPRHRRKPIGEVDIGAGRRSEDLDRPAVVRLNLLADRRYYDVAGPC